MNNHKIIITSLLLGASLAFAQQPARTGLRSKAEARIAAIEKRVRTIDNFNTQGLRFKGMEEIILAFEAEIVRLNHDIESNICPDILTSFKNSKKAWDHFYAIERNHFDKLNECLGTMHLEAAHYALINLLSSRCSYLATQLIDFERR